MQPVGTARNQGRLETRDRLVNPSHTAFDTQRQNRLLSRRVWDFTERLRTKAPATAGLPGSPLDCPGSSQHLCLTPFPAGVWAGRAFAAGAGSGLAVAVSPRELKALALYSCMEGIMSRLGSSSAHLSLPSSKTLGFMCMGLHPIPPPAGSLMPIIPLRNRLAGMVRLSFPFAEKGWREGLVRSCENTKGLIS